MKKIISMVTCLTILFTVGCKKEPAENKGKEKTDYLSLYAAVLDQDYGLIKNIDSYESFIDGKMGIMEVAKYLKQDALNEIGYLLKDVNGDEVPELLIGMCNEEGAFIKHELFNVYTLVENKPVFVLEGRSRDTYALMENNSFYNHGSNGAAYSIFGEYALDDSGNLVAKDFYFSYHKGNDYENIGFYHNTSGIYETQSATELQISQDEFFEINEAYAQKTANLEFTPFSSYSPTEEGPKPTESPTPMVPPFCGAWECGIKMEGGVDFSLVLNLSTNKTARYYVGPSESEIMADFNGEWTWDASTITFSLVDKVENGTFEGTYGWELKDNQLILSHISGDSFIYNNSDSVYVFYRK